MRQWIRVTRVLRCGLCDRVIPAGEPVLRVQLAVVAKPLWRCVECYGPAPRELPLLMLMEPRAPAGLSGMSHVTAVKPATRARCGRLSASGCRTGNRAAMTSEFFDTLSRHAWHDHAMALRVADRLASPDGGTARPAAHLPALPRVWPRVRGVGCHPHDSAPAAHDSLSTASEATGMKQRTRTYWLSFADEKFLGAAVVDVTRADADVARR